ncbi:TrgA family protein [Rhodophyticola sp. CCM32]|uniref:TrgA family protein n=1 Tax=Rhodophyticola sp. CCM32 TaxID=2916397 RepID=UPI00107F754B|nr:TrgA family protein [Rhodophyticola sp. CCM32]QBY00675.1 TrgA family protein [Rhodophyticola sp. CCM32]
MLTAAKLVAALLFAGVGYGAAYLVTDTFPEGQLATYFPASIAGIGLWQGWYVMGGRAGHGYYAALGNGFRTSVQITFFGLLLFALREMFMRSASLRYDGPGEAVIATLELFLEYFWQMQTAPVLVTLTLGGALAGLLTEKAARSWR